jgi:hypothetical protein
MPAKVINTQFGHSLPPEEPHAITFYMKGWQTALRIRDGDATLFSEVVSMYPRILPWGDVRQVSWPPDLRNS